MKKILNKIIDGVILFLVGVIFAMAIYNLIDNNYILAIWQFAYLAMYGLNILYKKRVDDYAELCNDYVKLTDMLQAELVKSDFEKALANKKVKEHE